MFAETALPAPTSDENRHPRLLLWLVAASMFMQTLDSTIVNTALPAMARSLGESPLHMQAVVVAYALTMAVLIAASGWLAERFGTRRVFAVSIALFMAGSAACAASSSLAQLVAARVVQGAGGAMLMPVGRLAVLRAYPKERFLRAMSFVAVPGLLGPLIGPPLGGWLTQAASWHWIFLINLPVGAIGLLLTAIAMPDMRAAQPPRFDLRGYLMLAGAMLAASLTLDGLGSATLGGVSVVLLALVAAAALMGYIRHARRAPAPLFSPRLLDERSFRIGLMGNLAARLGAGAMPYLLPLLLQLRLERSPLESGLSLLPMALAAILARPLANGVIGRLGYRRTLVGNTVMLGVIVASFAFMAYGVLPQPLALGLLALLGAANSLQFTAMNTSALKDLSPAVAASGNSLFSMMQMLGMSLGVSCGALLLHAYSALLGAGSAAAFAATLVTAGALTALSALIFRSLD